MQATRAEYTTARPIATHFSLAWVHVFPTTERSFDSQAIWAIEVLGLFSWHVINGCLYNQALADVRSTGAGIKCLYCMSLTHSWFTKEWRRMKENTVQNYS